MTGFPFLAFSFFWNLVAILFVLCCIILILMILIQKGKGGGLSSAFGGGMASGLLGTKTGDFLTWVTIVCVAIMLTLAVLLAKYYRPAATQMPVTPAATAKPAAPPQRPAPETNLPPMTNTESSGSASIPMMTPVEDLAMPAENSGAGGTTTEPAGEVNAPGN
jgi:preprotein translocase subunit SecG